MPRASSRTRRKALRLPDFSPASAFSPPVPRLVPIPLEDDRAVRPAEPERVRQGVLEVDRTRPVGHEVEIATLARIVEVEGGGQDLVADRQRQDAGLEAAGRSQQVSG